MKVTIQILMKYGRSKRMWNSNGIDSSVLNSTNSNDMMNENHDSNKIDHICMDFHKFDMKEKYLSHGRDCYDKD